MKNPLRSSFSTEGRRMAGARALWRANGMKEEQFGKPIIAIVNSFTQFVPGHTHLHEIGQLVKAEIEKQGCFAAEFNTIAIDVEILEKRDPQIMKIDGKYVDFNYIQIEEVNYGNFPHPAGEGRVNVSDEEIIIRQIGYNKYPGTPSSKEVSFEHIISAEPGSGFHVRNEDSLLQWTPPSTWEPVADVEGYGVLCVAGHYGATVRNSMGETCEIDLVCNVASTSIWG